MNLDVTFTGNGLKELEKRIIEIDSKFPLGKISDQVKQDLIAETRRRGWKHGKDVVQRRIIDKNTHEIYLGGDDKLKKIYEYQQFGTEDHMVIPRNTKALHWKGFKIKGGMGAAAMGKGDFFSKGHMVKGIKATYWFRLYETTLKKIQEITTTFINKKK